MATVVAVGLGPAAADLVPESTRSHIAAASTVRLRTRRHPAAGAFPELESFDELYERAPDFETLYRWIAEELVALATADESGTVVYAVPGSPLVAERTVAMLRQRPDVDLVCEPAPSFLDLACAALGIDPVDVGLRLGDCLALPDRLRGPGPLLLAQAHSPEVLADVALRVDDELADEPVLAVVLHHLGLDDERVLTVPIGELGRFTDADHLTSLYLPALRTAGDATESLVALMATLRERCPWDRVQTHASLGRYLLEEAYETADALELLATALSHGSGADLGGAAEHAEEELGDLLFQVVFHAHLAEEEGLFDLRGIADTVERKLVARHPHVFGDAVATSPDAVARRWEDLKLAEKGRASVLDGIPDALPALSLMAKVRRKALAAGIDMPVRAQLVASVRDALDALPDQASIPDDATIGHDPEATAAIGSAIGALCDLARLVGVDPEQALRVRVRALASDVRDHEAARNLDPGWRAG